MKKSLAFLLIAIMTLNSINIFGAEKDYADRQYVISQFVRAVGKNSFSEKTADLSVYSDSNNIKTDYKDDLEIAVANNIVSGYNDNTLKPDNLITRAEAAVILSRCIGDVQITQSEKKFTDVPQWALESVNKLVQGGIINGYDDTTFGSADNITKQQVGILTSKINEKLSTYNLKDDYYEYFNEVFKRNYTLEGGEQSYSSFDIAEDIVNERVAEIIGTASQSSDSDAKRINDVYNLYMDIDSRNSLGIEPLMPYINRVKEITSVNDIPQLEAYLYKELNISPLFNFSVKPDIKNTSVNVIQLGETKVLMNRSFYFELESDNSKSVYEQYLTYILQKSGMENASSLAKEVYNFEKSVVQKSGYISSTDYKSVYKREDISKYFGSININEFLNSLVGNYDNGITIYNSSQALQMSSAAAKESIDTIKAYYITEIVTLYAEYLSEDIANSYYTFLSDANNIRKYTIQDRAGYFVKYYAGTAIVRKYAEKYYDSQKEENIKKMISTIKENYKEKIENNSWLSDETKAAAVNKLENINIKVGYFKGEMPYSSQIVITPKENGGTIVENVMEISKILSNYNLSMLGKSVDKNNWSLSPLSVNACYILSANEIIIPMGILESPFYSEDEDYYVNLASIGSVIAHEISHAFDPMGAMFDSNGNYNDWWSESDKNKFYDLSDKAVRYFGRYEVINGIDNNGSNTLYENVSDLSGLTCIIDIAKKDGVDTKIIMETYAKLWSEVCTDQYLIKSAKSDSHSVSKIRVNAVLSSIDEFYDAYDITPQDGMYVAPENRINIW